jgi:hypothetical protein
VLVRGRILPLADAGEGRRRLPVSGLPAQARGVADPSVRQILLIWRANLDDCHFYGRETVLRQA